MSTVDDNKWYAQLEPLREAAARPAGARRPMYLMHKYWARKPWYFVKQCIEHYTRPGDTVLDPFCGSGVTLAEGLATGRRVIGVDVNPVATLISRLTCAGPLASADFDRLLDRVAARARDRILSLYELDGNCPRCGQRLVARWVGRGPAWLAAGGPRVRLMCPAGCPEADGERPLTADEAARLTRLEGSAEARAARAWLERYPLFYPDGRRFDKKRRQDTLADLFSARNLLALKILRDAIAAEAGPPPGRRQATGEAAGGPHVGQPPADAAADALAGELLWLTLTAASHLCSSFRAPRAGHWAVNGLYVPPDWVDENVWVKFRDRAVRARAGKVEANKRVGEAFSPETCHIICGTATDLSVVPTASVDYVFTDPPYGDSIQYYELSYLWNCLLEFPGDHSGEIIINQFQGKNLAAYRDALTRAFSEAHRVLRPGRWLTVTFANKNSRVWDALLAACAEAGFELVNITTLNPISRAYNQIWASPAPKTDLVINFWRPAAHAHKRSRPAATFDLDAAVRQAALALIAERGQATTGEVSEEVLKRWIAHTYGNVGTGARRRAFSTADVEAILSRHFAPAGPPVSAGGERRAGSGARDLAWLPAATPIGPDARSEAAERPDSGTGFRKGYPKGTAKVSLMSHGKG